jgi:hypothetical protein
VAAVPNNSAILLDVTRGTPNYTYQLWQSTTTSANQNNLVSAFYTAMENESTPGSGIVSAMQTWTDAQSGFPYWDHVCVSWNRSVPTIEVAQIAAVRFQ